MDIIKSEFGAASGFPVRDRKQNCVNEPGSGGKMPRLTCTFLGLGAKFYSDGEGLKIETTKSFVKNGNVSSFNPEKLSSHHFRVCDSWISDPGKLSTRDSVTEDGSIHYASGQVRDSLADRAVFRKVMDFRKRERGPGPKFGWGTN